MLNGLVMKAAAKSSFVRKCLYRVSFQLLRLFYALLRLGFVYDAKLALRASRWMRRAAAGRLKL